MPELASETSTVRLHDILGAWRKRDPAYSVTDSYAKQILGNMVTDDTVALYRPSKCMYSTTKPRGANYGEKKIPLLEGVDEARFTKWLATFYATSTQSTCMAHLREMSRVNCGKSWLEVQPPNDKSRRARSNVLLYMRTRRGR
jgi:hypothetical protein